MGTTIHILSPEYAPSTGGVAAHTRQIAAALAAAGDDVHVWVPVGAEAGSASGVTVHPVFTRFDDGDLARVGTELDAFAEPRRLFVQWVPHGYGFRAMNLGICTWLWRRARKGDRIEVMVHEPYLAFWEGSWRQAAAALVHRVMTVILLRAARRVWTAIPAWEAMWRPFALGRAVPFAWLPVPDVLPQPDPQAVARTRERLGQGPLLGHLGTYGTLVNTLLADSLPAVLARSADLRVVLIGDGSQEFAAELRAGWPQYADRVAATGRLADADLAAHVAACDVLLQPYPDGVSSRRTTAMAALHLGVPLATTVGRLSEPFWRESGAIAETEIGAWDELAGRIERLLRSSADRGAQAERGRQLYDKMFGVQRVVAALRGV